MRRKNALVYAAAALVLGAASVAVARAQEGTAGNGTSEANMTPAILLSSEYHEKHLQPIADEIHRLVDTRQVDGGFTSIVFHGDEHYVELYWKGPVPAKITDAVDAWRSNTREKMRHEPAGRVSPDYEVRYRQAAYSQGEMAQAVARFVAVVGNDAREWSSISPANDGSGLLLSYQPRNTRRLVPAGSPVRDYEARVEEIAGMPVHPEVGSVETPARGSRTNDSPPWTAGADLTVSDNSRCSTGVPGWVNKKRVLLTAAHCQTSGNVYNGQRVIGEVTAADNALDVAVITTDQSTEARFYSGSWNSGDSRPLYGPARMDPGHTVCFSGATSGFHCELEVTRVGVHTPSGRTDATEVKSRSGGIAVAQGDSGGPAVANPQGDSMAPVGVITAGNTDTKIACSNVSSVTTCYSTGYYTPLDPVVSRFGFSAP
ncbi:trypsin-like serine protease [Kitasatospora sp. NPDC056531]|uniref:trypsin-like serine protease n=1 Tax=Kitasatospora sp. NPDC056531 TaxID=3345856 RepID=UPI0036CF620C